MSSVIKCSFASSLIKKKPEIIKPIDLTLMNCSRPKEDEFVDPSEVINKMMEKAKREAEIIVKSARAEAQTICDEAYKEGYQAGAKDAADAATSLIERLDVDIDQLTRDRNDLVDSLEPQVLKLCMDIADKVIRHEAKTDRQIVIRVIKSCLRRIKDSSEVYIHVNPSEIADVRALRDEFLGLAEGVRSINITDDRRIVPGGCVIESASGDFDARIDTQIDKIKTKLLETMNDNRSTTNAGPDELFTDSKQD